MHSKTHSSSKSFILGAVSLMVLAAFTPGRTLAAQPAQTYSATAAAGVPVLRNPFKAPAVPVQRKTEPAVSASLPPLADKAHNYLQTTDINILTLSYAKAKDVCTALAPVFGQARLGFDPITNSILFKGSEGEATLLQHAVKKMDVATRQVTLEARIIALNKEFNEDIGLNWGWDKIPRRTESHDTDDDDSSSDSEYDGNFKFWRGYSFRFNATLNALIADGKAKILATPRIITIPGKEADIFIGDHIPVQTEKHDSGGYYTATEYVDAGIKLQYTPIVSADGSLVTAAVHTEVSTPTLISELKNYRITSRTANTNVRMRSGETLVIGGLINDEEQRSLQKIPLLSSIPLLGELFKNRTKRNTKTEVIMLLTPYITEAGDSPAIYHDFDALATATASETVDSKARKTE